ncbi:MAG: hypothetical protein H7144_15590 [Burkholderiales bacterium]|nr:hypothetical protein [Phycisphaerae bacterium]
MDRHFTRRNHVCAATILAVMVSGTLACADSPTTAPADMSLGVDEYTRIGLPAIDRPWDGDDMSAAADVLQTLLKEDPRQFPRRDSPKSGEVFARLISSENLAVFERQQIDAAARLSDLVRYFNGAGKVRRAYHAALLRKAVSTDEVLLFHHQYLRVVSMMATLAGQLPLLPARHPRAAEHTDKRTESIDGLRRVAFAVIVRELETIRDAETFDPSARGALLGMVHKELATIGPFLTETRRQEVIEMLEKMINTPEMSKFQPQLRELSVMLRSLAPAVAPVP